MICDIKRDRGALGALCSRFRVRRLQADSDPEAVAQLAGLDPAVTAGRYDRRAVEHSSTLQPRVVTTARFLRRGGEVC